jgi:hypothetical protein
MISDFVSLHYLQLNYSIFLFQYHNQPLVKINVINYTIDHILYQLNYMIS